MNEFEIIKHYFRDLTGEGSGVVCGIGDDAAVVEVPAGKELVVSVDSLVSGVHFTTDAEPQMLGYKALAVNLSDLAAMGAQPAWVTLALTLPGYDADWLAGFASGFAQLARHYHVSLIGGDLTRGPLSITVQAQGLCDPGYAITRAGARAGDDVYISGYPGEAGFGLSLLTGAREREKTGASHCLERLLQPEPRMALGRLLSGLAHAAIDVSDGLAADLGHIVSASGAGAEIELQKLPVRPPLADLTQTGDLWNTVLASGDDYELCFTVPAAGRERMDELGASLNFPVTRIGKIVAGRGVRFVLADGTEYKLPDTGYKHF